MNDYVILVLGALSFIIIVLQRIRINILKREIATKEKLKKEIYILCERVSKASNKEEAYFLILDSAIRLISKADKGSILILEDDGKFHFKALRGYAEAVYDVILEKEDMYLYRCNNFKDTAIINDPEYFKNTVLEDGEVLKRLKSIKILSTLSSPIYVDEKLIGIINVDISDISNKQLEFDEEDIKLLKHVKYELELALKNFFAKDELKYMVSHDDLTKLYNRRSFKEIIADEIENIKIHGHSSYLALVDIDNFKNINDNYGHNIGDKALILFAKILCNNIPKDDICARMSGDEFIVIFINKSEEESKDILENVKNKLSRSDIIFEGINFSYGLSPVDINLSVDEIVNIADKNMYINKKRKIRA